MIKKNKIAIYARLSKEDEDDGSRRNSVSIDNQIATCKRYLKDNNLTLANTYFDDGYSGSNFNRPGFKQMIQDIENRKIDGIIVKDLSRLGRDFLKTSYYIEDYFPSLKIRFISINDKFDSFNTGEADIVVAISNFLNGFYLKECRKKQKLRFDREGETRALSRVGIFGYQIVNDEYQIEPYSASIVIRIFDEFVNQDRSMAKIAEDLNKDNIPTPYHYKKEHYLKGAKGHNPLNQWTSHHVRRIIDNRIYTGDQVNFIFTRSHEGNKRINKTPTILKNHHTAIISKSLFAKAMAKIKHTTKAKVASVEKLEHFRKFFFDEDGLTYTPHATGMHKDILKYKLRTSYKADALDGKEVHKIIFKELKQLINLIKIDEEEFYKRFSKYSDMHSSVKAERRNLLVEKGNVETKVQTLFEDLISNNISESEYKDQSIDLTLKITALDTRLQELDEILEKEEETKIMLKDFVKEIKNIDNFSDKFALAKALINKVIVTKKNDKYKFQIIYKFSV